MKRISFSVLLSCAVWLGLLTGCSKVDFDNLTIDEHVFGDSKTVDAIVDHSKNLADLDQLSNAEAKGEVVKPGKNTVGDAGGESKEDPMKRLYVKVDKDDKDKKVERKLFSGWASSRFSNDNLRDLFQVKDGLAEGYGAVWNEEKDLLSVMLYQGGVVQKRWTPDGKLSGERQENGDFISYYPDGEKKMLLEAPSAIAIKDGVVSQNFKSATLWYKSGKKAAAGPLGGEGRELFTDGWEYWDKDGESIPEAKFDHRAILD